MYYYFKNVSFVERGRLGGIYPSRAICKGDLMTPYMFVLCLKRLFHLLNVVVDQKTWKPLQLAKGCANLTHLILDDIVLFSEANPNKKAYHYVYY